jgi:RNA polymerase sigma factor (sigma-70 family)
MSASQLLDRLYRTEHRQLVRIARSVVRDQDDAEDVVQDVFAALLRREWQPGQPEHAAAYLKRAVCLHARSVVRRRVMMARHQQDEPGAQEGTALSAESAVIAAEEREMIADALRQVPPRQREALVLRFYGDLTHPEIAEAMSTTSGTAKSYTSRGVQALRRILEPEVDAA